MIIIDIDSRKYFMVYVSKFLLIRANQTIADSLQKKTDYFVTIVVVGVYNPLVIAESNPSTNVCFTVIS